MIIILTKQVCNYYSTTFPSLGIMCIPADNHSNIPFMKLTFINDVITTIVTPVKTLSIFSTWIFRAIPYLYSTMTTVNQASNSFHRHDDWHFQKDVKVIVYLFKESRSTELNATGSDHYSSLIPFNIYLHFYWLKKLFNNNIIIINNYYWVSSLNK